MEQPGEMAVLGRAVDPLRGPLLEPLHRAENPADCVIELRVQQLEMRRPLLPATNRIERPPRPAAALGGEATDLDRIELQRRRLLLGRDEVDQPLRAVRLNLADRVADRAAGALELRTETVQVVDDLVLVCGERFGVERVGRLHRVRQVAHEVRSALAKLLQGGGGVVSAACSWTGLGSGWSSSRMMRRSSVRMSGKRWP